MNIKHQMALCMTQTECRKFSKKHPHERILTFSPCHSLPHCLALPRSIQCKYTKQDGNEKFSECINFNVQNNNTHDVEFSSNSSNSRDI